MKSQLIIGTRPSKLALWQAEHVKSQLEAAHPNLHVTLKKITTKGDQILDRSLVEIGGKGLFLKEIEDELLAGTVDLAVHSMKDVPYILPDGLTLSAILKREDPSDAWLSRDGSGLERIQAGAVIGTTSLRRKVQLQKRYPQFVFRDLRGNVDTRLKKLQNGEFDAIILATAGLNRLGLAQHITHTLDIVSAVGQGAIGLECRDQDADIKTLLQMMNHPETAICVHLERYFLQKIQGSCQTPVGALCTQTGEGKFWMHCFLAKPDGSNYREECFEGDVEEIRKRVDEF